MRKSLAWQVVLGLALVTPSGTAVAWGERGHALITQVAARLVVARAGRSGNAWRLGPFRDKEFMLAHLSNLPDIQWKDLPRSETSRLNPAHWFNLEHFGVTQASDVRPWSLQEAELLAERHCGSSGLGLELVCTALAGAPAQVPGGQSQVSSGPSGKGPLSRREAVFALTGSAPYRVEQLARNMQRELATVKVARSVRGGSRLAKASVGAINQALTFAGLMAHYVGDLAQPLHVTTDHDGYKVGLGGLHAYFETEVVAELGLDLVAQVHAQAQLIDLDRVALSSALKEKSPLAMAFLLAANSYARLPQLQREDRAQALLRPSESRDAFKVPALRRPAPEVAPQLAPFAIERLALGAAVLAEIYWQVWQSAGAPDLSGYASFFYSLKATPVPLDYLAPSRP